jgi:hypothetical protein
VSGNISGSYIFGNGSQLTGIIANGSNYGNSNVIVLLANVGSNQIVTSSNIQGGNLIATGQITATGNVSGGNLLSNGNVAVLSAVKRTIWVSNVAPQSGNGAVGDIWYQTV